MVHRRRLSLFGHVANVDYPILKTNFLVSKRNLLLNSFFSWPLRPPTSHHHHNHHISIYGLPSRGLLPGPFLLRYVVFVFPYFFSFLCRALD